MPLIITKTIQVIDTEAIARGDLITATRNDGMTFSGVVSSVSKFEITLYYIPDGTGNGCYLTLRTSDIISGKWSILWGSKAGTVSRYPEA